MLQHLRANDRGGGAVEFALVAPVLFAMLLGVAQLGILFLANAGLKSAVEEGARYAVISPRPTTTQIAARIQSKKFGLTSSNITGPTVTLTTSSSPNYVDITMGYNHTIYYVLGSKTITLSETRRAFVPSS